MKPFSISCTTCGARLKVRDERAIGELSLCPKCGSMVMVTPPTPGGEAANGPRAGVSSGSSPQLIVGGGGAAGSDFDDAAALLADTMDDVPAGSSSSQRPSKTDSPEAPADAKPAKGDPISEEAPAETPAPHSALRTPQSPPPPIEPSTESMSSIELDPKEASTATSSPLARAGATATVQREPVSQTDAKPTSGAVAAAEISPTPLNPHSAIRNPQSETWQRYGMIAAAVLAAIGLVTGLLMLVWPQPKPPAPAVIADAEVKVQPTAVADDEVETDTTPVDTAVNKTPQPVEDDLNVEPEPPDADIDTSQTDVPIPPTDAEAPPLFAGPEDTTGDATSADEPTDEVATADTGLGDLVPFIDAFPVPPAPARPVPPDGDGADDLRDPKDAIVLRERPEPRTIDLDARLADKIDGIDAGGAPLAKFIELISDLSTIPITLDPAALAQVKARPDSPVSLTMTDTTVAEVLSAGLATHRLSYAIRDEQLVVIAAPRSRERLLAANYDVEDLAADEAAMKILIEHIHVLVEPASWKAAGGAGTLKSDAGKLVARNTQDAHFALHVFLQKLRVARGLKLRSSFDPALFALTTRTEKAQAKLDTPVRAVFHAERPLTKILGHLEKAAGVNILVDWQSLIAAGWPTTSTATLIADDVPLDAALERLLAPMELAHRAIDETTLQITSMEAYATEPELEFHSIADLIDGGATPDSVITKLKRIFGEDQLVENGGNFAFRYDEPAKCILVRVPQIPQRIIAEALSTLDFE